MAKLQKWKPQAFIKRLAQDGGIFKRGGCWLPYQIHLDAGRFSVYTGESQEYVYQQTPVEPKGVAWLAERYGIDTEGSMAG